jgi:ATP-dependent RNA helicase DDX60
MMRFIHPVSTLSFAGIMPPDLSLEAPDLLRLYEVFKAKNIGDTEQLDPIAFFSHNTFIRQKDVLRYEAEIKDILSRLVAAPDALGPSSPLQQVIQEVQDPIIKQTPKSRLNSPPSRPAFLSGLIHLLSVMRATDGLVSLRIVFLFTLWWVMTDCSACTSFPLRSS